LGTRCFTVDRSGAVVVSTLPRSFPVSHQSAIASIVLRAFRQAEASHAALSEVIVRYPTLTLRARELRGGAIIYLVARTTSQRPASA
jgi:hypothetical protein